MNNILKRIFLILICISFFNISGNFSFKAYAAGEVPEKIRIGLFFRDTSAHNVNTAVSCFNINSEKGLRLGFVKDGKFNQVYEGSTSNDITIRKDSHFVKNNNVLKEYEPSAAASIQGEKIGPYHIKIGGNYTSLSTANAKLKEIKGKEVPAYIAFVDSWQIWTGAYSDAKTAEADMKNDIAAKLGSVKLSTVEPSGNRIVAESENDGILTVFGSSSAYFQIWPGEANTPYAFKLNGILYRGDIEVRRYQGSDMTVINIVPLQQYLYGVLPGEIEASSHPEALKAQAVAARTYTINSIGKHTSLGFDLCNTTGCQVYKGFSVEAQSANKAVDDTKGQMVTYNGKPAQVFYFSSSGGRTEDVQYVWGSQIPYLKSVEDKYESGRSWNYTWESTYTANEIKQIMLGRNYNLGDILNITIADVSPAGRVTELIIEGTRDERVYMKGACRSVLSNLHSQWYTISTDADIMAKALSKKPENTRLVGKAVVTANGTKVMGASKKNVTVLGAGGKKKAVPVIPTTYKFTGRGWGHAVGMSQEGAKGMAKAGFKYDEILMHYFQGTKVE
jgi:stage II sporulation protein D